MTTVSPNPFPAGGLRSLSLREAMQRAAALACILPKDITPAWVGQVNLARQCATPCNWGGKLVAAISSWRQKFCSRLLLAFSALSTGCLPMGQASAMDLVGYNHTDQYIAMYTVDGYPGDNIYPHEGGGSFVCCISVPREWKPNMFVTVKWTPKRNVTPIPWKTRVVEVPPYSLEDIGLFAVHFFPGDEVKVLVTTKGPRHPEYPYPSPSTSRRQP